AAVETANATSMATALAAAARSVLAERKATQSSASTNPKRSVSVLEKFQRSQLSRREQLARDGGERFSHSHPEISSADTLGEKARKPREFPPDRSSATRCDPAHNRHSPDRRSCLPALYES